jgi:hypothetical protein
MIGLRSVASGARTATDAAAASIATDGYSAVVRPLYMPVAHHTVLLFLFENEVPLPRTSNRVASNAL